MRELPPLNTLRVFEVAARAASYADAGAELRITHGAVSRQIAALEHWLGHRLFIKEGRRMVATPMAKVLAEEVRLSFDRVAAALQACGRPNVRRLLRVSAPTSFAMRWLIPRLPAFHAANPETEVVVTTVSTVLEALRGGVDVAIRRGSTGHHAWPGHKVIPVLQEADTLIMSPALFAQRPVLTPGDVEGHTLLATETRAGEWQHWLDAAGLHHVVSHPRQVFDHFFITRQAVEDGLGIGIGPVPMLDIDLASGKLIAPLPHIQVAQTGYVAVVPHHADEYWIMDFVQWLAAQSHP